ncbi:MAG: UDP-N-acetylmuramoyl-tripeptide--D-alanyl-D-alanine ligase [Candidatus Andersenbacteria bacterium]|nr:UDP-N-acetylmuramoyl-tripeptide--D-alanyl-D-alanine ligase [Candidatus Andersenbacteria bacterium]
MRTIIIKVLNILSKKMLVKYKPVVIGITGSVGKSSTKKAIYKILKRKYKVHCDRSCYNADISIPLAITGFESGGRSVRRWIKIIFKAIGRLFKKNGYPDVLILEMGVNRPNDMKKMLAVVKPDIGILTGIGKFPSHTEYFKDAKHIVREKSLLARSLRKKDLAILNLDDEFIKELPEHIKSSIITYGFNESADVRAEEPLLGSKKFKTEDGSMGMRFKISYQGTTVPFRLPHALGRGQIYSTLSAVAVGIHFGFNLVEMSEALSSYHPLAGRMKMIKGINESLIIDDTFNSSPSSALSALETVEKLEAPRKIAVLGDMLELGEQCEIGHKEVGKVVPNSVDFLFTYGSKSEVIARQAQKSGMKKENIFHFENIDELIELLKNIIQNEDIILVKGSRAMHMEKIVKEIMAEPQKADELLVK